MKPDPEKYPTDQEWLAAKRPVEYDTDGSPYVECSECIANQLAETGT